MSIPSRRVLEKSDGLRSTLVSAVALHILEIIMFLATALVVKTAADLAGYDPGGNFIIMSAAILSAGSAIAGGLEHLKSNED